jgi:hypothetical protein
MVTFRLFQDVHAVARRPPVVEGDRREEVRKKWEGVRRKTRHNRCESKILQDLSPSVFLEFLSYEEELLIHPFSQCNAVSPM